MTKYPPDTLKLKTELKTLESSYRLIDCSKSGHRNQGQKIYDLDPYDSL